MVREWPRIEALIRRNMRLEEILVELKTMKFTVEPYSPDALFVEVKCPRCAYMWLEDKPLAKLPTTIKCPTCKYSGEVHENS